MRLAIEQALLAKEIGEVPIGAIVVKDNEVVGSGYNKRETQKLATSHAELIAIEDACKRLGGWRLHECDLYVTLEPCPMCSGAIINSRIKNLFFGAFDSKAGCCGSVINIFENPFNHKPQIFGGLLQQDCGKLLTEFFLKLRKAKVEK
ncbi:MAG: deaminase [Oscillospiraceae bacterium]|nr:deaminase [Oscillospiraceae bacterium]